MRSMLFKAGILIILPVFLSITISMDCQAADIEEQSFRSGAPLSEVEQPQSEVEQPQLIEQQQQSEVEQPQLIEQQQQLVDQEPQLVDQESLVEEKPEQEIQEKQQTFKMQPLTIQPLQTSWMFKLQQSVKMKQAADTSLEDAFGRLTIMRVLLKDDSTIAVWGPAPAKFAWEIEDPPYYRILIMDTNNDKIVDEIILVTPAWERAQLVASELPETDRLVYQAKFKAGLDFVRPYFANLQKKLKESDALKNDQGHWTVKYVDKTGQERILQLYFNASDKTYSLFTSPADLAKTAEPDKTDTVDPDKADTEDPDKTWYVITWTLNSPMLADYGDLGNMVHKLLTTGAIP